MAAELWRCGRGDRAVQRVGASAALPSRVAKVLKCGDAGGRGEAGFMLRTGRARKARPIQGPPRNSPRGKLWQTPAAWNFSKS